MRHTPAISAQRTATDDLSDCANSQNDDVIKSPVDHHHHTEALAELGELTQARDHHHEDREPNTVPLIAVYNNRNRKCCRQLSADLDEVEAVRRPVARRRTLSLRRQLLITDPTDLVHDRSIEQVLSATVSCSFCT